MFYPTTFLLTLVSYVFTALAVPTQNGCALNLAINAPQAPLVVDFTMQFPVPISRNSTTVYFARGELFYVSCPEGTPNYPIHNRGEPAVCHGNTTFSTLKTKLTIDFNNFTCHQNFRPFFYEMNTNVKCVNDFHVKHIGHSVDENWVQTYSVCFDKTNENFPFYDTNIEWKYVHARLFDDLDMYDIYGNLKQRIEDLGVHGYITDDVYLMPGQLAAYSDFLYPFQRDTAFDYANAAIQWNTIRDGNWKVMVESLPSFIVKGGFPLKGTIFRTGTLGVAALPNSKGVNVDLFVSGDGRIPVPRWFWKLFWNPFLKFGIFFFVYNNPFVDKTEVKNEYFTTICKRNFSDSVYGWMPGIDNNNPLKGYIFAGTWYQNYTSHIIDPTIKAVIFTINV